MRLAFFQFSPAWGKPEDNCRRMIQGSNRGNPDLVVFPELATSGYLILESLELERMAEPVPGPSTEIFQAEARKRQRYYVLGLPEKSEGMIYNSAVLIGPSGVLGLYRKVHLFHQEKRFFQPGNLGFPLFEVEGVRLGLLVCFDHLFPEAARTLALQGVQVICHPSNLVIPEYGQLTTRVRSIENRVFWILANRTGDEQRGGKNLHYTGGSQIVGPKGGILAGGSELEQELVVVDVDPDEARDKQVTATNDLFDDRRPETYRL